jgi:hypothetical protein
MIRHVIHFTVASNVVFGSFSIIFRLIFVFLVFLHVFHFWDFCSVISNKNITACVTSCMPDLGFYQNLSED